MKYIIIPIIALGFTLCSLFGVEYTCLGHELFPHCYGSPFIYMRNNLGSSLEYYYSITGLFFDVITWSLLLLGLHFGIDRLIKWTPNQKLARVFYYSFVDVFVFFSALTIYMAVTSIGSGFDENSNYWFFDIDLDAQVLGVKCKAEWKFIELQQEF
jgi:hypothetical protein